MNVCLPKAVPMWRWIRRRLAGDIYMTEEETGSWTIHLVRTSGFRGKQCREVSRTQCYSSVKKKKTRFRKSIATESASAEDQSSAIDRCLKRPSEMLQSSLPSCSVSQSRLGLYQVPDRKQCKNRKHMHARLKYKQKCCIEGLYGSPRKAKHG